MPALGLTTRGISLISMLLTLWFAILVLASSQIFPLPLASGHWLAVIIAVIGCLDFCVVIGQLSINIGSAGNLLFGLTRDAASDWIVWWKVWSYSDLGSFWTFLDENCLPLQIWWMNFLHIALGRLVSAITRVGIRLNLLGIVFDISSDIRLEKPFFLILNFYSIIQLGFSSFE